MPQQLIQTAVQDAAKTPVKRLLTAAVRIARSTAGPEVQLQDRALTLMSDATDLVSKVRAARMSATYDTAIQEAALVLLKRALGGSVLAPADEREQDKLRDEAFAARKGNLSDPGIARNMFVGVLRAVQEVGHELGERNGQVFGQFDEDAAKEIDDRLSESIDAGFGSPNIDVEALLWPRSLGAEL